MTLSLRERKDQYFKIISQVEHEQIINYKVCVNHVIIQLPTKIATVGRSGMWKYNLMPLI